MSPVKRISLILLACTALLPLTGCIGAATPMVKRQRGPSGQQLAKDAFDPTSVKVGETTREQVRQKFSVIDTGVGEPNFFWGRWATSKWGYFVGGGYPPAAVGDAGRIWSVENLLVTFDDRGVAQTSQLMKDGVPLWREIIKLSKSMQPTELATPISLKFENYGSYAVTFSPSSIEVVQPYGKVKKGTFTPDKIRRLSHGASNERGNPPGSSCHVLHLSEKIDVVGQQVTYCADPSDLLATFRYLQRYAPADMKWE